MQPLLVAGTLRWTSTIPILLPLRALSPSLPSYSGPSPLATILLNVIHCIGQFLPNIAFGATISIRPAVSIPAEEFFARSGNAASRGDPLLREQVLELSIDSADCLKVEFRVHAEWYWKLVPTGGTGFLKVRIE